jgi:hypothetical protein
MAAKKMCPFLSFAAKEGTKDCLKNGCELWVFEPHLKGTVGCTFRALAARLNIIEEHLGTIAVKAKY